MSTKQNDLTEKTVNQYYNAWNSGRLESMGDVLANDLRFRGPIESHDSSATFMASCKEMVEKDPSLSDVKITSRRHVVSGDELVAFYCFDVGRGKPVPMAEHFRVIDGEIKEINLYFDSKRFE